jgi:hypothetical protein
LKRSLTDVLRRGILSTLANWPVILTRVAELLVQFGIAIVAVVGLIVPLLVSAGVKQWTLPEGTNPSDVVLKILSEHAALFTYLFLFILAIGTVMVAVHSFVTAGAARIYVDADRKVPDAEQLRREQFEAFTMERWSAGARGAWWRLFWIYNATWTMFGLILLIPVIVLALLTMIAALSDAGMGAVVAATCGGLALVVIVAIPLALVIGTWTQKAVVVCLARDAGTAEALRSGWREVRADFLRHFLIYFLISVVAGGASAFLSSALAPLRFGFGSRDLITLFTGPVQVASFFLQAAASNAVGCWLIASFAAMTGER